MFLQVFLGDVDHKFKPSKKKVDHKVQTIQVSNCSKGLLLQKEAFERYVDHKVWTR